MGVVIARCTSLLELHKGKFVNGVSPFKGIKLLLKGIPKLTS